MCYSNKLVNQAHYICSDAFLLAVIRKPRTPVKISVYHLQRYMNIHCNIQANVFCIQHKIAELASYVLFMKDKRQQNHRVVDWSPFISASRDWSHIYMSNAISFWVTQNAISYANNIQYQGHQIEYKLIQKCGCACLTFFNIMNIWWNHRSSVWQNCTTG